LNFFTKPRRAAATAAGALVLGSMTMVAGATAAHAGTAPVATTYTCALQTPISQDLGDFPVTVADPLPASAGEGDTVPARPLAMTVTLSDAAVALLNSFDIHSVGGTVEDNNLTLGSGQDAPTVPITGLIAPDIAVPATGSLDVPMTGTAGAFTAPAHGTYDVNLPDAFTFDPSANGTQIGSVLCTLKDGQTPTIGSFASLFSTTTAAKLKAPVTVGKHGKVHVTVTSTGPLAPTGKVKLKEGKKKLASKTLSSTGSATIRLPKLARGKHKIVAKYVGDQLNAPSKDVLKFRVRRH
jgi:hypothetical protein